MKKLTFSFLRVARVAECQPDLFLPRRISPCRITRGEAELSGSSSVAPRCGMPPKQKDPRWFAVQGPVPAQRIGFMRAATVTARSVGGPLPDDRGSHNAINEGGYFAFPFG